VGLEDDLRRAAEAAAQHAGPGERVEAVIAAEPSGGRRVYLCAFDGGNERTWLAVDDAGAPVTSRALVRETVSITALCEVAEETAGGGQLEELRAQLLALRLTENPPGIDDADEAALALEATIGAAPRVATPAYLDEVGAAARRLEEALGDAESPFARAMASAWGSVESLTQQVESAYKQELT
jgi:hypothetical protein